MDRATYSSEKKNPKSWYSCANSFHTATKVLGDNINTIDFRALLLNAALSIELLLKAIIVATGKEFSNTHSLPKLAEEAEVPFSPAQQSTLELLAEILIWRGRYPVPTSRGAWSNFFDNILEKHTIRERTGNVYRRLKRPETFPTKENVERIWKLAHQRWDSVQPKT